MYRWRPCHDQKEAWLCCFVKEEGTRYHSEELFFPSPCLGGKDIAVYLKVVLSICAQVVNVIGGGFLHHRLFKLFSEKMGSEHQVLFFYTEVRWQ